MAGLSVVVEPGEAGFFAGECVQVRITFRNDRDANTGRRASVAHDANAHSRTGSVLALQTDSLSSSFRLASASVPASPVVANSSDSEVEHMPPSPMFPHAPVRGEQQLLWAYAQLSGSFSIDQALLKPFDFELVKQRIAQGSLHTDTGPGRAVGGGELIPGSMAQAHGDDSDPEENDGVNPDPGFLPAHSSLDSLVLGLGLPSPLDRSAQDEQLYAKLTGARPPRRVRSVSVAHLGGFPSLEERSDGWTTYLRNRLTLGGGAAPKALPQGSGGDWARVPQHAHHRRTGSTLADKAASTVLAREVPTLSMPPSVLCVDLKLRAGESKSFDLSIPLPPDLPPSYMGTSISFTYTLSIGTNRQVGARQRSRIVQIPIRVFTHVARGGEPPFWDLLNPIIWLTDHGTVTVARDAAPLGPHKAEHLVSRSDLESYARTLLNGAPLPPPPDEDDELNKTCLDHADMLTRTSPKVSYDIAKDGQVAAILTLTQSKYRLGDTIRGVLTVNASGAGTRIVRAKVLLECYEEIQADLRKLPADKSARLTTRPIESTEESTLDMGQWAWELTVPPTLAPSFHTSALNFKYTLKLSLLTLGSVRPPQPKQPKPQEVFPSSRGGAARAASSAASTATSRPTPPPAQQAYPSGVPVVHAKVPPPHLVPSRSDGFEPYHERLQAVPSLVGALPFVPEPGDENSEYDHWLDVVRASRETKLEIVECSIPLVVLPSRAQYSVSSVEFAA